LSGVAEGSDWSRDHVGEHGTIRTGIDDIHVLRMVLRMVLMMMLMAIKGYVLGRSIVARELVVIIIAITIAKIVLVRAAKILVVVVVQIGIIRIVFVHGYHGIVARRSVVAILVLVDLVWCHCFLCAIFVFLESDFQEMVGPGKVSHGNEDTGSIVQALYQAFPAVVYRGGSIARTLLLLLVMIAIEMMVFGRHFFGTVFGRDETKRNERKDCKRVLR